MPELLLAVGAAALLPHDGVIELGSGYPAADGGWQLAVELQGDRIIRAEPRFGLVHRGDEQLLIARDYRQLLMQAGRHAWFTSFSAELAMALAIEAGLGITVNDHVAWSRMLLAELDRIQASLLLTGTPLALTVREEVLDCCEAITGNRVHPMATRIGGMGVAVHPELLSAVDALLARIDPSLVDEADDASAEAGLGVVTRDEVIACGASGPVAWGSGLLLDARLDAPYLRYGDLPPERYAGPMSGDVTSRMSALRHGLADGLRLARACLPKMRECADQPLETSLPKTVRLPEGMSSAVVQTPLGWLTVLLDSEGDRVPSRVRLRTPSFANAQAMALACRGATLDDLPAIVRSAFMSIGEIDR